MRKTLALVVAICAVCAVANVASGETIWGLAESWSVDTKAQICSWDAYTGVFIRTPVTISDIMGNAKVASGLGLAVQGTTGYVSYTDPLGGAWLLVLDLQNMTKLADLSLAKPIRSLTMSLDGSTLYGGAADNYVYAIDKTTGALTQKAGLIKDPPPTDDFRAPPETGFPSGNLVGTNPLTGEDWLVCSQAYYKGDFDTSVTYWADYRGSTGDQPGSQMWRSDGVMLHSKVGSSRIGYNIAKRTASGTYPAGWYVNNPDYWPSTLYNLETVNSYTFLGAGGMYGMSPVFPVPEPATMGLLLMGGLAMFRRKRQ